jgi:metal-sulfur cluster biosynthetic enzyme
VSNQGLTPLGNVKAQIVEALSTVLDPELGVDIIALGLIYDIGIENNDLRIAMTMTTPACPLNSYFTQTIERTIRRRIPNILHCEVEIVWQPQWDPSMMSAEGKLQMGWR